MCDRCRKIVCPLSVAFLFRNCKPKNKGGGGGGLFLWYFRGASAERVGCIISSCCATMPPSPSKPNGLHIPSRMTPLVCACALALLQAPTGQAFMTTAGRVGLRTSSTSRSSSLHTMDPMPLGSRHQGYRHSRQEKRRRLRATMQSSSAVDEEVGQRDLISGLTAVWPVADVCFNMCVASSRCT